MKTINMKRIFSCLLLGASYLLSNAQGIIVYKTDGTQIKVPYEQLDSIAAYQTDDGPVVPPNPYVEPVTINALTGTWSDGGLNNSRGYTLSFNNDNVLVQQEGNVVYQGQYTLENNVVSFDIDGTHYESMAGLAGGQSVLIMKEVNEDSEFGRNENLGFIVVKDGMTINTKKEEILGQWACWWSGRVAGEDKTIRIAYKFEGDNFEVIIVPWGQKYTGTYTYDKGIITLDTKAGYTSREPGTGNGWGEGDLDPITLEGNWSTLNEDRWNAPGGGPFFAIGDQAFGLFLMPTFCTRFRATTR
jgi:hypothetical protein